MSVRLILGSSSPRRKRFFDDLGVRYTIRAADIDESQTPEETPVALVERLALEKARAVAALEAANGGDIRVLGADTIVVLDGVVLGKPESEEHAREMLQQLSGRTHLVLGAAVLTNSTGAVLHSAVSTTEVDFVTLDDSVIRTYIASGEPADKAGSYAIQGKGTQFVQSIRGSFSNVVGLDMAIVSGWLRIEGFL